MIQYAYGMSEDKTIVETELPEGKCDFIANLRENSGKALQREIAAQFGLVGRYEMRPTEALILAVKDSNNTSVQPSSPSTAIRKQGMWFEGDQFRWSGQPMSQLANWLERYCHMPVVDRTGLTNRYGYNFNLKWSENDMTRSRQLVYDAKKRGLVQRVNYESLKRALDEVGLTLVATNQPVEMLVVERVKR